MQGMIQPTSRSRQTETPSVSHLSHGPSPLRPETVSQAHAELSPNDAASTDVLSALSSTYDIHTPTTAVVAGGGLHSSGPAEASLSSVTVQGRQQHSDSAIDWSWLRINPGTSSGSLIDGPSTASNSSGWLWNQGLSQSSSTAVGSAISPLDGINLTGGAPAPDIFVSDDTGSRPEGGRLSTSSVSIYGVTDGPSFRKGIEEWIPWSTLMRILQAYHTYLYALCPVMHWPTFLQLLMSREDERSKTWRAYLLSLVSYSIIQLPRSALSFLEVPALRQLHRRCYAASVSLRDRSYQVVTTTDIATLYCDHIYLSTLSRTTAANVALCKAIRLAQEIKLYDEGYPEVKLDRIELEVRRRVFWLLYGSDRTISAMTTTPLMIADNDLRVPLPSAIDDNLITASGAFPQPPGVCSVLCGFHFVSRIFGLLGAVLTAHRSLSPQEASVQPDSSLLPALWVPTRPACQFRAALQRILDDLPHELRLIGSAHTSSSRDRSESQRGNGVYETCKANLLVSQAMVRFAIRQYAAAIGERDDESEMEDKDWVEKHVLSTLQLYVHYCMMDLVLEVADAREERPRMLSESLAANGESLRNKVLYIASNLIDKYHGFAEVNDYVSGLLGMYARIREEQHASLLESVESAGQSRASTPARM
nr:uncharacterized protein CI109_006750 [Kwoniella shandongensis]KAA5524950.1 hypothetical protein CI109_006750 [Kwoniella shandongensis]